MKVTCKRTPASARDAAKKMCKSKFLKGKRRVKGVQSTLTFGCQHRPSKIIVMLHGLNDSAADCSKSVVGSWVKGLPGALIVVPQSPDKTPWSSDDKPGYDWVPTKRLPPWDAFQRYGRTSEKYEASLKEYRRVLRARCRDLNSWLDALLRKHGLSNKDLVLVGFSLGAYLSSIVGAQRNVRGAIVCGGMCSTREVRFAELLPRQTSCKFLAVNGTKDTTVQRRSLEDSLKLYDHQSHWSKGVGHDFPREWYKVQLRWMQRLFHGILREVSRVLKPARREENRGRRRGRLDTFRVT